jgi:hypothetical protein
MEILTSPEANAGSINLEIPARGHDVMLSDHVIVSLDGDRLTSVEILNLSHWGDPFDEAAAERVLAWVREQLTQRDRT